jgi:hypothetical protein
MQMDNIVRIRKGYYNTASLNKSIGAWRSPASALAWGARGRRFKSSRPDFLPSGLNRSEVSLFRDLREPSRPDFHPSALNRSEVSLFRDLREPSRLPFFSLVLKDQGFPL